MITFYNKQDLIEFGNYILSKERKQNTRKINRKNVTDADLANHLFNEDAQKPDNTCNTEDLRKIAAILQQVIISMNSMLVLSEGESVEFLKNLEEVISNQDKAIGQIKHLVNNRS